MKKFMACALSTCMVAATLVACEPSNPGTTPADPGTPSDPGTPATPVEPGETFEPIAAPTDGTYGDWAITESPIGFFWGGTWVVSSQAAVDAGKAEGVKAIMEYITLDDSENGLQYAWANGTFNVSDDVDLENIKPANGGDKGTIELWNFTNEIPKMVYQYVQDHPDFGYNVHVTIKGTGDGYQDALDQALMNGQVDVYGCESAFVLKYTQGDMAKFAAPYESLGIDAAAATKAADIAGYTIDIGTRPSDGKLVGLGYQATGGVFIYRRSIAKDVWGSDDPAVVKEKIGGGSGSWDTYWNAAEELKAHGYGICSGDGDMWHAIENSSDKGWIVDDKLYIDPKREAFFDISKKLKDNGYHNDTQDWGDAWFADMKGQGEKQVLGFFGPAWLINYTMLDNCGNKPEGLGSAGDCVASGTVMAKSKCTPDFLAGQNMFDVFVPANAFANGKNLTQYDEKINTIFRDKVREYTAGNMSKEEAIDAFKTDVNEQLGIAID